MSSTYKVSGMTCGGCAGKVKSEISKVDGVTDVEVDLTSGTVTVAGAAEEALVRDAVEEAGYELTAV
ncbi:heavy-metal-associated domain-containing protein [Nonomuraea aurantiaca]|jgi:copper chaperone CopZ|uniref:heavy-metal-associated domain-containing protein n=1 Tax=Nonomuraea aurantiaca TaxID=2878562 RepID=UPI001CDA1837|nr:heavy metal-associated domain-containing protein [Nonomuraea aurantiaca]MCA2221059.1 heavy-metal-associated domain-containing protein [Nonomuraea aurantiaca]